MAVEGMVLVKLWLHISADEQLRRFRKREADPLKQGKLTEDDWRNRRRRPDHEQAIQEMLARIDHDAAPWHVVAAESTPLARVTVLETVIEAPENGLRFAGQQPVAIESEI